jgi:type IV pilus assembly protein PilA
MKNFTKKKGFTLIELIIVIAVIGIVAAIAVPKFGNIQKNAKVQADFASAKVIADSAVTEYAHGNITALPTTMEKVSLTAGTPGASLQTIPDVKGKYDKITSPVFCVDVTEEGTVTVYVKGKDEEATLQIYPPLPPSKT